MGAVLEGFQELVGASLRPDMLGAVYWIIALVVGAFLLFSVLGFLYFLFFLVFPLTGWVNSPHAPEARILQAHPVSLRHDHSSLSYDSDVLQGPSSTSISGA